MTQLCTCVADFNAKLREHNTEIIETIGLPRDGSPMFTRPKIETKKIESRRRVGPVIALPTFCPFCGASFYPEPAVPEEGVAAANSDELQSYEKFDGVGPHSETIETRARIGERFLECYESALDDPLLKGYCPADCPSEIVLDLLERLRQASAAPAPSNTEKIRAAAIEEAAKTAESFQIADERDERDNARNATAKLIASAIRAKQIGGVA